MMAMLSLELENLNIEDLAPLRLLQLRNLRCCGLLNRTAMRPDKINRKARENQAQSHGAVTGRGPDLVDCDRGRTDESYGRERRIRQPQEFGSIFAPPVQNKNSRRQQR